MSAQPTLFEPPALAFDAAFDRLVRHELVDGAWVDHAPRWLAGEDRLFAHLVATTRWRTERRRMYEREVEVPRLLARLPVDGPGHPVLDAMGEVLARRYDVRLRHLSLALYRDGRDSVAFHGDRGDAADPGALTVSVSLGTRRRLLMRPAAGGTSLAFSLGGGDLFVMGGTCQRTWQHGIPKVARAEPRLAVLYWFSV